MRPLLVANFPSIVGGGEIGLELLAEGLVRHGITPVVATPGRGTVGERFERHVIPPSVTGGALAIRRLIADVDLIHTMGSRGLLAATLARTGKPVIFHALTDQPHDLDALHAEIADLLICNSKATADRFGSGAAIEVVYNGIPEPAAPVRRLGLDQDVRNVGVIGRPAWWKGQLDLVEPIERILQERDDVAFVFAGRRGGPVSDAIDELARRSGGRVRVLGWVPRIRDHLAEFDLIVVPSRVEGFGRVAAEALRAGVPVLARRAGGLVEVLEGVSGPWLAEEPGRWKEQILDRLERPVDDPQRLRQLGARFDIDVQVRRMVELYQRVVCSG